MRRSVVVLGVLWLLSVASDAEAMGRLEPVRDFRDLTVKSAGNALVWTSPAGVVMVADHRARVRHRFRVGARCSAVDANRFGEALVICSTGEDGVAERSYILNTSTGRARSVTLSGQAHELGRRWIVSIDNPGQCYHCETLAFTNRRTGQVHKFDGMEAPEYDLDAPTLRRPPGGSGMVAYEGKRWLSTSERAGQVHLWLHDGDRRRLLARCPHDCWAAHIERGRVAYVSGWPARGGVLYDLDLRSGRKRSWRVPRRGYWLEFPLRVRGTLLMVSERRDSWRLWRTQ
jgi:hypothetical protein